MDTLLKKHIKKHMYKILDLFSGLGGFSLGLERTGCFKTIAFCDNNKFSKLILDKHWKGVKVYNDVREITKERFIADGIQFPDIITGGFPCQPFSVAGKQKGTSDDRHLWPDMFRIIKAFKPRYVIGENVRGIINIQDGVVFETVCTDLESEGYEVQPFIIPAAGVGAPHRRERVWIVAHSSKFGCGSRSDNWEGRQVSNNEERQLTQDQSEQQRWESGSRKKSNTRSITESRTNQGNEFRWQDLSRSKDVENTRRTLRSRSKLGETNEDEVGEGYANQHQRSSSTSESDVANTYARLGNGENEEVQSRGQTFDTSSTRGGENVADTRGERLEGQFRSKLQGTREGFTNSSEDDAQTNSERLEGFGAKHKLRNGKEEEQTSRNSWWLVEPNVGRVAHGVPGRVHRLKGLGNSIVPQIAEEIGRAIIKAEKKGGYYE